MAKIVKAIFTFGLLSMGIRALPAQVAGQWVNSGTMQSARQLNAQVRVVGGDVLSTGGVDNNGNILASAELYNPGPGTWALTGSMAQSRELFPAVLLTSGKVLVTGGLGTNSIVLAGAELYDPTSGTWSPAGSLSVARFGHTATVLSSGKVLVTGGCTTSTCSADTPVSELYDPTANSWSTTGSLSTARYYHTAVRLKTGSVLVIGGSTGSATNSCELYNSSKGTWSSVTSMNAARFSHTTTLLSDGKVLVTGGTTSRFPIGSAELYDPSANTWTLTGNMITARYAHSATLLTDNTVLVAGGEGQSISCGKDCTSYIPTSKAEIYNETAGTFTAAASLNAARAYHAATLLSSGRALANGGSGVTSVCCVTLSSAEVYTPLTLTLSASSLTFGVLQTGLTSASQTVTVTNVSSHSATFTSIASSGDFSQTDTCPTTLNAGQSCSITVTFTPTVAGALTGAVTLKDNDPGNPTQTIALTGTGATNAMTLLPASVTFPGQTPGTTSAPMNLTLYNDGTAPVNITSFSIAPANGAFSQTNNCPATLNPGTNCVIQVVFRPPDSGKYSATLSVIDSDRSSPQTASLSGTGLNN
jgi:N-acetylneuraminic acid mutarotase